MSHKTQKNSTNQSKFGNRKQEIPAKSLFLIQKQGNPPKKPCRQVSQSVAKCRQSVVKCHEMSQNVTECHKVSVSVSLEFPREEWDTSEDGIPDGWAIENGVAPQSRLPTTSFRKPPLTDAAAAYRITQSWAISSSVALSRKRGSVPTL